MVAVVLAAVDPVWPVNGTEPAVGGSSALVWVAVLITAAVAASGAVSYFGWRDRRRHTPEQRAFRAMARRLRLGRRPRAAVEELAAAAGMPAVALLISERAFAAAIEGRPESEPLKRARDRVFADR